MKAYATALSAFLAAATLTLASPAPYATPTTISPSAISTSVSYPAPIVTGTSTSATNDTGSLASPAQASAIASLLALSPEGPSAPKGTLIEILVTSDQKMYVRYQHAHPHYRDFNTTDGKAPPLGDLGYAKLMEAMYGGQSGSLGESMAKAWSLYKQYYGGLPSGVPSQVLSETGAGVPTATATATAGGY